MTHVYSSSQPVNQELSQMNLVRGKFLEFTNNCSANRGWKTSQLLVLADLVCVQQRFQCKDQFSESDFVKVAHTPWGGNDLPSSFTDTQSKN